MVTRNGRRELARGRLDRRCARNPSPVPFTDIELDCVFGRDRCGLHRRQSAGAHAAVVELHLDRTRRSRAARFRAF